MIENVAVDDPITAATMNALINNVNGSPGRAIFVTGGIWSVPAGVTRFKVTLCGGGGGGGPAGFGGVGEDFFVTTGGPGGDAPMISAIFTGDEGQSFPVTVGAAGLGLTNTAGTASSFGTLVSNGGQPGAMGPNTFGSIGAKGAPGVASFPAGAPSFFHTNELFCHGYVANTMVGYGRGGTGDTGGPGATNGKPGVVVIEW